MSASSTRRVRARTALLAALALTLGVVVLLAPFASTSPDGLEKVAEDEGFAAVADEHPFADAPLADYGVDGLDHERLATVVAGVIGVGLILGATWGLNRLVRGRTSSGPEPAAG